MSCEIMAGMKLSDEQVQVLEQSFKVHRYPDETSLMLVAAECGLTEEETIKWFKLRNAQWRQAEGLLADQGKVFD
ncbi:homeodomain-only protein [Labrus mixtus]|uniref:homeodomain-only protein n=1 Tax=Labrus mixtus TaxID=508554 RepID=UPI0029C0DD68|nr:homeodomain-only protein [Labrus mixtus]